MTDDETEIRQAVSIWMDASRRGDLETVLSLMTDDVVFMVPGREPFGREAFAAAAAPAEAPTIEGTSEIVELQVLGDVAFTRNHIDIVATSKGADPVRRAGYTLTLFRRCEDGRWRLFRDANLLTIRP